MDDETLKFARIGAGIRLAELQREMTVINQHFPDLRAENVESAVIAATETAPKTSAHYMRTPKARKATSLRMRKYWAKKRREEKLN